MTDSRTNPVKAEAATQEEFRRDKDFVSRYANNFQVESTAFDLKLIFGLLDQSASIRGGKLAIEQHTAISLAWPEVKLLIYFLQLHLTGHEKENGKVKIPSNALPPEIPAVPPPQYNNSQGREAFETLRKMRAEFIAKLSEP